MRIIIDLHACQTAPLLSEADRATLALAQDIAGLILRGDRGHQLSIAFDDGNAEQVDALRQAFDGLVAPQDLIMTALPAAGDCDPHTHQRLCRHIREGALAGHAPDLVFVADFDIALTRSTASIGPLSAAFDTVIGLRDATAFFARAAHSPSHPHVQACAQAVLAVVAGSAARDLTLQALRLPYERVLVAADAPAGAAALLLQTFEQLGAARAAAIAAALPTPATPRHLRPRLAYVSPLPPEKSGIADYSTDLLPVLAAFYDIDIVVDQPAVSDIRIAAEFTLRSAAWFDDHASQYDRVLYHFGNSSLHKHMFKLLEKHPGIVVLHDFFLGNMLDNLEGTRYDPTAFLRGLTLSHGYSGLSDLKNIGRSATYWKYPCNKIVLDQATGVIVHSELSRQLAAQWYGQAMAAKMRTIALLRADTAPVMSKADARARLGLDGNEFVVASFGLLGPAKLNDRLLDAWLQSPLAADRRCRLIFVGGSDGTEYSETLLQTIAAGAAPDRISVTEFVSADDYRAYLAAADCAVQFRSKTRGETSAAILDCLLAGLVTIVNAHGSATDLPDDVLVKLPDAFTQQELIAALSRLRGDAPLCAAMSERAIAYVRTAHNPEQVGLQYRDAIEHFARTSRSHRYRALIAAAAGDAGPNASASTLAHSAVAIAANLPPAAPRTMYIDISAVVQSDIKTGIQRVVRSIVQALFNAPPPGYRIEPVYTRGGNRLYQHARRFAVDMTGCADLALPADWLEDTPIDAKAGDIFLGLDLLIQDTRLNEAVLANLRRHGVDVFFVVYDILPLLRPDVFPDMTYEAFHDWLRTLATVADGLICISRAVADEVHAFLEHAPPHRAAPLKIDYFHLGADIAASLPTFGMPEQAEHILATVKTRPTLLAVGTVEPRKGHAQALDAFEALWARGVDVNYVIVGKHGWMVDGLADRLNNHPENGRRLFWLAGVSDEMLLALYESSSALLAASEGEGFGLPLIEAAQHHLPVIARNLPVFREVLGEHGFYFDGLDGGALADAVSVWLDLDRQGAAPQSDGVAWLTWAESATQLCDVMLKPDWYRTIAGKV